MHDPRFDDAVMEPERVREILRQYGSSLPDDPLFDEATDRSLRAELRAAARTERTALPPAEDEERSVAVALRRFRRRERVHYVAIGTLAAAAAALLFVVLGPRILPRDPEVELRRTADRLVLEGARARAAGSYAEAEEAYRDALERLERVGAPEAERASLLRTLGDLLRAQGKSYGAELHYQSALELRLRSFPNGYLEVAEILEFLADQATIRGDAETARERFDQLARLFGPRHRDDANRKFFEEVCATSLERQADLARRLAERESSESSIDHFRRYVESSEALLAGATSRPVHLANLAHAYRRLAELSRDAGDLDAALAYFQKSLGASERLTKLEPTNPEHLLGTVGVLRPMAAIARQRSDLEECRELLDRSHELLVRLVERSPGDPRLRRALAELHGDRGELALQRHQLDRAVGEFERYVTLYRDLAEAQPDGLAYDEDLALAHARLARVEELRGRHDAALAQHREVLAITERLSGLQPENPRHRENSAASHARIADLLEVQGRDDDALDELEHYVGIYEELSATEPRYTRYLEHLSHGYARLAELAVAADNTSQAAQYARLGVRTDQWLLRDDPENPIYRDLLLASLERAGDLNERVGSAGSAAQYFRELARLRGELFGQDDPLTVRARSRQAAAIVADPTSSRRELGIAEGLLRDALEVLGRLDDSDPEWHRDAMEALRDLYGPDRLDDPRKLESLDD